LRRNQRLATKHARGFTLTELAIAFFIIGLLLASAFMPLSSQMEVRNIADTRRTMDQIKEALIGFAQTNGRLPCPANPTLTSSTSTAGNELYTSPSCTSLIGVIPWATLGVPETDAWGRRFTYRVASVFSDALPPTASTWQTTVPASQTTNGLDCTSPSPTPTQSSFALCSLGEMAVLTRAESNHATKAALGTGLAAVIISHGKNGFGAWQTSGIQLSNVNTSYSSNVLDEVANSYYTSGTAGNAVSTGAPGSGNNYTSYLFYSRTNTPSATSCDDTTGTTFCEFDDIVTMISANALVARMVSAGRLP
jgi:type II secretory pathway pseudopilin PulG